MYTNKLIPCSFYHNLHSFDTKRTPSIPKKRFGNSPIDHLHHRGLSPLAPFHHFKSSSTQILPHSTQHQGWLVDSITNIVSKDYDAILVLGGGLLPDGGLPPWVKRRLDGALYIFKSQPNLCPILLLGAGTPHKPPVLSSNGYVLHESTAYASYLMERGVPALDILKETSSYDTVGNGYFSATMHAVPANWTNIAVVTSDFHMPRTRAIFNTCYKLAAKDLIKKPFPEFRLWYHPVSDEGLFDPEILLARAEKEQKAVETWHQNTSAFKSISELHRWLFATHLCYAVARQHEFGVKDDLDPRLAATY